MAQLLYICNAAFVLERRGREHWVMPGEIAQAGSWPLEASPGSFTLLAIDYPARGPEPEPESEPEPQAAPRPVEPVKPEAPTEPEEPKAEEPAAAPAKRPPGRPRKHHT